MPDQSFLEWPFLEPRHRQLAEQLEEWCRTSLGIPEPDLDSECRSLVRKLGSAGFLKLCVADSRPDVRSLAIARETLAYHSALADFVFAMQGLGSGAITLFGSARQRNEYLPKVAAGDTIAAFAMTEPTCGSDAANIQMSAVRDGDQWVLAGEKSYISNGGIADFYVTFARTGESEGARGLSAFIVDSNSPGLAVAERIDSISAHPLARLTYDNVRVPATALLGEPGEGFRIGMETLNLFRVTVGAAALGFARRAFDEALAFATSRRLGDGTLAHNAVTQAKLADMALLIDASALLTYRAAWQQDEGGTDNRKVAAMAKLHATEAAQQVIDAAVQMHGGAGVTHGVKVEALYRDIRALRIYEGASEVQRQIIARALLKGMLA